MAAASKGLSRTSSTAGSERGQSPVNEKKEVTAQPELPILPDTPSKILPVLTFPEGRQSSIESPDVVAEVSSTTQNRASDMLIFPFYPAGTHFAFTAD